ncbi:HAD family hydrolase [Ideonella sp.]|uniref:HAD family hydrolase n=1 Tax=Ideonella sp. TaxID=1929293 RepID=UPI002B462CD8|nr:HAD family hydrolase [Ideonella sp.]HJV68787.1 HAD family hydrolase [Ideonella sp.]
MKLVIFDLDDTLIDFASTRQAAYRLIGEVVEREGIAAEPFLRACAEVDRPLFARFERGELTRTEYRARRFLEPFDHVRSTPRDGLVEELNRLFMDCVNDRPLLHDDALPVLRRLRAQGLWTAILTNGPSDGQRRKLRATGLGEAVDLVAIGEEIGASKPMARAFRHVVDHFGLTPPQALMVGDSPALDHDAALDAGLAALLLDRAGQHAGSARACVGSLHAVAGG